MSSPQQPDAVERRRKVAAAGHRRDLDTVRSHLDDPDAKVRLSALAALANAGGLEAPVLEAALADPDRLVRHRAIELAPELSAPAGATRPPIDLTGLLDDPDELIVEATAWALGEQQPTHPDALDALCRVARSHPDSLCRESAVAALGSIGDERALDGILEATTDIATVRRRAVIALAPFGGPRVEAALQAALTDRDWQVRQAAEDLLDDTGYADTDPDRGDRR